jgi:hypothetical protein
LYFSSIHQRLKNIIKYNLYLLRFLSHYPEPYRNRYRQHGRLAVRRKATINTITPYATILLMLKESLRMLFKHFVRAVGASVNETRSAHGFVFTCARSVVTRSLGFDILGHDDRIRNYKKKNSHGTPCACRLLRSITRAIRIILEHRTAAHTINCRHPFRNI